MHLVNNAGLIEKGSLSYKIVEAFGLLHIYKGIKEERDVPTPRWDMQQVGIDTERE